MVFRPAVGHNKVQKVKEEFEGLNSEKLEEALKSIGLDVTPKDFNLFLRTSIEGREFFKFEFTKSLSLVLDLIQMLGKLLDIDRKDLSWISAYDFKECFYLNNEQMGKKLNAIIVNNKKHYDKYLNAILPDVILDITSVSVIPVSYTHLNHLLLYAVSYKIAAFIYSSIIVVNMWLCFKFPIT